MRLFSLIYVFSLLLSSLSTDIFTGMKELLYGGDTHIKMITKDNYEEFINRNYSLLYFGTPGCKTCMSLENELLRVAEDLNKGKFEFVNPHDDPHGLKGLAPHAHELEIGFLNVREFPELRHKLKAQKVPTLRLYHHGLSRRIPDSLYSKYGIETFVEQRIHLRRLPVIHNYDRLKEVVSSVPHALVLVVDGVHKIDHLARKLMRNLQFSLSHFHFYVIDNLTLAAEFKLAPHGMYEISEHTKGFTNIEYKDLIINGTVDVPHFDILKKRVYDVAHPKIQMLDLKFVEKYSLEDMTVFYSTDQSYEELAKNQKLLLFNNTCRQKLYHHTRCAIANFNLTLDIQNYDRIYHVQNKILKPNTIIHFITHFQGYKKETFLLEEEHYTTEDEIATFHKKCHHHEVMPYVELSEPIPDNTNAKIHKIVALEVWKYYEREEDVIILAYNSSEVDPDRLELVIDV